jgi:hypothetical protein
MLEKIPSDFKKMNEINQQDLKRSCYYTSIIGSGRETNNKVLLFIKILIV